MFLAIPQSYIRIALFLIHHSNKATKREIIESLTELGSDPRNPKSIERIIRYMKSDGILVEKPWGTLSLKNPKRYRFVIRWIRGDILDRWFVVSILFSMLAFIFSFLDIFLTQLFIITVLILVVLSFVDDFLHQQSW